MSAAAEPAPWIDELVRERLQAGTPLTFHVVRLDELQRFLFDVLDAPELLEERLRELMPGVAYREDVANLYRWNLDLISREEEALGLPAVSREGPSLDSVEDDSTSAHVVARYLAAVVASCLHPKWTIDEIDSGWAFGGVFKGTSFAKLTTGRLSRLVDVGLAPYGIYSASRFATPDVVADLALRLDSGDPMPQLGKGGRQSLKLAVAYARTRDAGLILGQGVTIPGSDVPTPKPSEIAAFHTLTENVVEEALYAEAPKLPWWLVRRRRRVIGWIAAALAPFLLYSAMKRQEFLGVSAFVTIMAVRLLSPNWPDPPRG